MHAHEKWVIRRYLAQALDKPTFARPPFSDADILSWIERHHREVGLPALRAGLPARVRREINGDALPRGSWAEWRSSVILLGGSTPPRASRQEKRIRWLCQHFGLERAPIEALELLARLNASKPLLSLVEALNGQSGAFSSAPDTAELLTLLPWRSDGGGASAFQTLGELGLAEISEGIKLRRSLAAYWRYRV